MGGLAAVVINNYGMCMYRAHLWGSVYAVPCTVMELVSGAPLLALVVVNMYTPGILSVTVSVCLTMAFTPFSSS